MQPPAISYGHYKSGRKSNHSTVVDTEVNKSVIAQERHVVTPPSMVLADCHTVSTANGYPKNASSAEGRPEYEIPVDTSSPMSITDAGSATVHDDATDSTLDVDGDVRLVVSSTDNNKKNFLVSSTALRMASVKWRALLNSMDSQDAQSPAEVEFSDDDLCTIEIILQIAHLRFDNLPTSLDFTDLLNLAITCHKYEVVGLVGPFLRLWAWPWSSVFREPGYEQWLFIAWVFGYQDTFEALTDHLAATTRSNSEGDCLTSEGILSNDRMPRLIVGKQQKFSNAEYEFAAYTTSHTDNVVRVRVENISAIIASCYERINELSSSPDHYCQKKAPGKSEFSKAHAICDSVALGSFLKGLKGLNLWPVQPHPSDLYMSVNELKEQLMAIRISVHLAHQYCTTEDEIKNSIMNSEPDSDTLEDEHLKHFARFKNIIDPLENSSSRYESDVDDEDDVEEDEPDDGDDDDFENEHTSIEES